MRRLRQTSCLRARRCTGALPVCRCLAGKPPSLAPQAAVNHFSAARPPASSPANNRRKVAWVRRPNPKATTCPFPASPTHQRQRGAFLGRTNDHLSSAQRREALAGSGQMPGRIGGHWLTASIFLSAPLTVCGLTPNTLAVSRTPLPWRTIAVSWSRTPATGT